MTWEGLVCGMDTANDNYKSPQLIHQEGKVSPKGN